MRHIDKSRVKADEGKEYSPDIYPTSLSGKFNGVQIALPPVSFTFLYSLSKEIFDLAINAAQFVLRPGFQFGPELRVNTK